MAGWETIVGHEWAVRLLQGDMALERVGHAYLFTGAAQIGKTTLARTFAQALNCTAAPVSRPCGACRACRLIAADRHPDVRVVWPEQTGRGHLSLKIEQIRSLQQGLSLAAYEARVRVAILPRFDAANPNAANAFLKTLEEPPARVVLLLTAIDADGLLPTITSRCRLLALRPLPRDVVERQLVTRWQTPPPEARVLAHLSNGRLGWAVAAAADGAILDVRGRSLRQLQEALQEHRVGRFALAEALSRQAEDVPELLRYWLGYWRDAALLSQGGGVSGAVSIINIDQQAPLQALAQAWSDGRIVHCWRQTNVALWQLARNANTRLVLENLLLAYPIPDDPG